MKKRIILLLSLGLFASSQTIVCMRSKFTIGRQIPTIDFSNENMYNLILKEQLIIDRHPELMSILRNKETSMEEFVRASDMICIYLAETLANSLPLKEIVLQTPVALSVGYERKHDCDFVPIFRSGRAMEKPFRKRFRNSRIKDIGLERREDGNGGTRRVAYYNKPLTPNHDRKAVVLDPMLATGGTARETIQKLLDEGYKPENIMFVGVIGTPKGVLEILKVAPKATIILAALDEKLDDRCFIDPGLGDYGDRYNGTEPGTNGAKDE